MRLQPHRHDHFLFDKTGTNLSGYGFGMVSIGNIGCGTPGDLDGGAADLERSPRRAARVAAGRQAPARNALPAPSKRRGLLGEAFRKVSSSAWSRSTNALYKPR